MNPSDILRHQRIHLLQILFLRILRKSACKISGKYWLKHLIYLCEPSQELPHLLHEEKNEKSIGLAQELMIPTF